MERINPLQDNDIIIGEHIHRYNWAKELIIGDVCDIACGMGYGSQIVMSSEKFKSYTGIDIDENSIKFALNNYKKDNINFIVGTCEDIPLQSQSIDTIVSLETLEHLDDPSLAIAEFERVLKKDGLIIGSVPSKIFEETCTEAYGPNIYHKQRFTVHDLEELLASKFKFVYFFISSLNVVSCIRPINAINDLYNINQKANHQLGSIMFVATNNIERLNENILTECNITFIKPIVEYDLTYLTPRDETIKSQTNLIDAKDELIKNQDNLISQKDKIIEEQTKMIDDRDDAIKSQTELIDAKDVLIRNLENLINERESINNIDQLLIQKDAAIKNQTQMIIERDKAIQAQTNLIDEKDALISHLEYMVNDRDNAIKSQTNLIDERDAYITILESKLSKK